jgi:putative protease
MEDRIGVKHVLHADIGCRNTLYNGVAQSGAEAVEDLMARGIQHFRIELLNDAPADEIKRMVSLYQRLLAGETSGAEVWRALRAENRLGVTRGTLEHSRNPLAIA